MKKITFPPKTSHVAVIGAGISGLASAALLAKAGYQVTVLEALPEVGGRAGVWEKDGFRFDAGPSWYLMPEVFEQFYNLLGTTAAQQLDLVELDPAYRVFFENEPEFFDISKFVAENIALFEKIEPGAGMALQRYLASAKQTYDIAKKRFLYTTFANFLPLLRKDVLLRMPRLFRLLLQPLYSFTGSFFKDTRLRQILGYPAVFLGSSPFTAPSMYHLMSHLDLEGGVLYPQGGFSKIVESMQNLVLQQQVTITCNAKVSEILTQKVAKKTQVRGVKYFDRQGKTQTLKADIVVSAADLFHTETELLPPKLQSYPNSWWSKKVAGPSAILLYLGVKGSLPELQHHNLFFTKDWELNFSNIFGKDRRIPSPASVYVCKPSASDSSVAAVGCENVFVLVPVPSDISIGFGGENGNGDVCVENVANAVIAQIASWAKIVDFVDRIVVRKTFGPADFADKFNAWQGTALGPAHVLQQSAFFRAGNVSKKVVGLYYVGGSTIPGIGLPMCLISAQLLLKRLCLDVSTQPLGERFVADFEDI